MYLSLFLTFLKIGAFTFGGGYAMIPLIQQAVLSNEWLSQEELIDFIAISESTPGPFAVNVSTFIGMKTESLLGALCATVGVVLPSFVIILLVARMYDRFQNSRIVNGAMIGLKGVVVGLIGSSIITTAISVFEDTVKTVNVKEMSATVVLLIGLGVGLKRKINPIILIILSAIFGMCVNRFI